MSSQKDYFVIFGFSCRSRIGFFFNILDHDEISELYATWGDLEYPDTTEDLIEKKDNNNNDLWKWKPSGIRRAETETNVLMRNDA